MAIQRQQRAEDLEIDIEIPLEHVARGGEEKIRYSHLVSCLSCEGSGVQELIDKTCSSCSGKGKQLKEEVINVTIPAGIEEGATLRVAGLGNPGAIANSIVGDLLFTIRTKPDPRFKRDGINVKCSEVISIVDAVLGTTLSIPTLYGIVLVKVPPGTQPNSIFCVQGKGLPSPTSSVKGDLQLRIDVHIPQRISQEVKKLYESIREYR